MRDKREDTNIIMDSTGEYENTKIPSIARKTFFTMLIVMLGYGLFPSTINAGAIVASNFNFGIFLIVILIGNTLLTIYALLMAMIGINSNASLHNLSKRVFGRKGYKVTSTVLVISQIGWFGVGIMMVSDPILALFHVNDMDGGSYLMTWILITLMGALITSAAFFGVRALKVASIIAIPIVLVSGFLVCILALVGNPDVWGTFDPGRNNPSNDITFFVAIGLVISTFISGATLIPDFLRWAKSKTQAIVVIIVTFMVLQTTLLMFGAMAFYGIDSSLFGDYGGHVTLYSSLAIMGIGTLGFIALFANVWTSNDNSLYSTGLAVSSMFNVKKRNAVIFLGIIGTLMAPIFGTSGFIWFLELLGFLIPGIGAILIADYYIFYKWLNVFGLDDYFYFDNGKHDYDDYKLVGILSWALGIAVGLVFQVFLPFIVPVYIVLFTGLIYIGLEFAYLHWIDEHTEVKELIYSSLNYEETKKDIDEIENDLEDQNDIKKIVITNNLISDFL